MLASELRSPPALLCALVALCLIVIGAIAPAAEAKRKVVKADDVAVGQLRGVNLTPMKAFMPAGQSDADNQNDVQSACRMGADVVRVFVMWDKLEPAPGQVDPGYAAKLDSLMSQAASCGTRVMFMLGATPAWASSAPAGTDPSRVGHYADRDGAFRRMVGWILSRWPALQSLEVWNEPNHAPYWSGTPGDYAGMVNEAVAAKRDAGSSTLILAGSLGSGGVDFLNQLYAAGMSGQDGISIHPYSMYCYSSCALTNPSPRQAPFRAIISWIHASMLAHGDRTGLWLTEFGFSTCPAVPTCIAEAQQSQWMVKSIKIASCYPFVRGLLPFTIRDIPSPDPKYDLVWGGHFGLLHTDYSPKPAYSAVASLYRGYDVAQRASLRSRTRKKSAARAPLPGSTACRRILGTAGTRKAKSR